MNSLRMAAQHPDAVNDERRESRPSKVVTSSELFFDLVFVFAIAQLSQYQAAHLDWRGLTETLVLLVAVFGVWSYTSFEVTIADVGQAHVQRVLLAVMAIGLFMNAAINRAFDDQPFFFVAPMLLIQIGRTVLSAIPTAPTPLLKRHYQVVLRWQLLSAPLWVAGGLSVADSRIWWWGAAALIDLTGTWLAHPWPGRTLKSKHVPFDGVHMLERLRLFLIIALGEVVLTSGRAIAEMHADWLVVLAGAMAVAIFVSLWALYFSVSDFLVSQFLDRTDDPILAARLAVNGMVVIVAGLVALAVANEVSIANPREHPSGFVAALMSGGAGAYLLTQVWYLRFVTGSTPRSRVAGVCALVTVGICAPLLPSVAAQGALALVLLSLWVVVAWQNSSSRRLPIVPSAHPMN